MIYQSKIGTKNIKNEIKRICIFK